MTDLSESHDDFPTILARQLLQAIIDKDEDSYIKTLSKFTVTTGSALYAICINKLTKPDCSYSLQLLYIRLSIIIAENSPLVLPAYLLNSKTELLHLI